ncbi:MAG TPA: DUF222 domain-containing protein [Nocardioides sp.]|nr:DUF222 domain-containing protein [Nocardioides sp.]
MSITQLAPPAVLAAVRDARAAVRVAGARGAAGISNAELGEAIGELAELESQVVALRLALSAEADGRGVAEETADTGTDVWLARLTGEPRQVMSGGLWVARMLQERCHHTREALATGRLRLSQAKVIVRAVHRAPTGISGEQVDDAEASLVAMATGQGTASGRPMTATRLRQAARRMFATISTELADRVESDQLVEETRRAVHHTWMSLHDNGDGTWSGRFTIPELQGRWLRQALERLSSPRRLYRDRDGRTQVDETVDNGLQNLSWTEHLGQAFCEVIEHLPTDGYTHGNAATLVTHLDLDALLTGLGAATLDGGVRISAGEARRLACEASIVPIVLDGASVPLDLGRGQRLHTHHQRLALSATHDTCAVGGCERPFAWCEIHHHRLSWAHGGHTDLVNALPLCGYHHRRAHDPHWDLRAHTSGEYRFHRRR